MLQHQQLVGMGSCSSNNFVSHILAPGASLHILMVLSMININSGKYKISPQTLQSHVVCHGKACLCFNIFLFMRNLKEYFLLIYKRVILYKTVLTTNDSIWLCDVLEMECNADDMAEGKVISQETLHGTC